MSPAEKLQFVEDLWDDLAANPTGVPFHDWQKEELARRKANLENNPASDFPGKRSSGRFKLAMTAILIVTSSSLK